MKKEQKISTPEIFPFFDLKNKSGWLGHFGNIPYEIFYMITGEDSIVNPKDPGKNIRPPRSGTSRYLSIIIHESVPEDFRPIVMFHELKEAELVFSQKISYQEAHTKISAITENFAVLSLNREKLELYHQWRNNLAK